MNRIEKALRGKKSLITFITGGDPSVEKTREFILTMAAAGADMIEIGIPFSDPVAEGPVIQSASLRALARGVNVDRLFEMVSSLRGEITIPLLFMTYLNPVFHYGYERFFARCADCGIAGIIIPDLPHEERDEVAVVCERYGVDLIAMAAPTSGDRIARLVAPARGFIYAVSSMGVTGARAVLDGACALAAEIKAETDVPVAVGFGVTTPEQARQVAACADAVIVGSALVEIIASHGDHAAKPLGEAVRRLKAAVAAAE
jgi:tryptophan synthase alpha chain